MHLSTDTTQNQILAFKKQRHFFCPACGGAMIFKAGEVKIPHFAHHSRVGCNRFSEPETPLHLTGKMLLHQFFLKKNYPAELERYFPAIKQRADVFVEGKWAIEFQCSPISSTEVAARTNGYASIALQALWIRGMDEVPQEGIGILKLHTYERAMLHYTGGIDYLLGYHPGTDRFFYRSGLFYLGGHRWAAKTKSIGTDTQPFPFATPKKMTAHEFSKVHSLALLERERFIQRQRFAKNRYQNAFWVLCYELGLDRTHLPPYIGIPIKGAEFFGVHPVVWQLQALAAERKGLDLLQMIESTKPLFWSKVTQVEALPVLKDYMDFAKVVQMSSPSPQEIERLLYAIYCKYL